MKAGRQQGLWSMALQCDVGLILKSPLSLGSHTHSPQLTWQGTWTDPAHTHIHTPLSETNQGFPKREQA